MGLESYEVSTGNTYKQWYSKCLSNFSIWYLQAFFFLLWIKFVIYFSKWIFDGVRFSASTIVSIRINNVAQLFLDVVALWIHYFFKVSYLFVKIEIIVLVIARRLRVEIVLGLRLCSLFSPEENWPSIFFFVQPSVVFVKHTFKFLFFFFFFFILIGILFLWLFIKGQDVDLIQKLLIVHAERAFDVLL